MMTKRNHWHYLALVVVLTAFLVGFGSGPRPAQALNLSLGGILKGALKIFGVAYVVKHFGGEINSFINGVLAQHSAKVAGQTKVVPIVRIGAGGTAVGAAQIMGPAVQVKKVSAVAEVEWKPGNVLRARGLLPVTNVKITDPTKIKGVGGVGVSANIKFPM